MPVAASTSAVIFRPSTVAVTTPAAAGSTVTVVGASTIGSTSVGACAVITVSPAATTRRVPSASAGVWVSSAGTNRALTGNSPLRSGMTSRLATLSATSTETSRPSTVKIASPAATAVTSAPSPMRKATVPVAPGSTVAVASTWPRAGADSAAVTARLAERPATVTVRVADEAVWASALAGVNEAVTS